MYQYEYPRPAVTVDILVFAGPADDCRLLLIRRGEDPFKGKWALPGGFVDMDENLDAAARRELEEETGLTGVDELIQVGAFGDVGRDPRGRVITVAYAAHIPEMRAVQGASDAAEAAWFALDDLPWLAFDHDKIIDVGRRHVT